MGDDAAASSYLVMEYLEGETLADAAQERPAAGRRRRSSYASQIADALDKAHRQGIVHRDLKPATSCWSHDRRVRRADCKLLDFGLAKIGVAAASGTVETRLLTSAARRRAPPTPLTAQGTILGTFQYMAPEQIEGQEADARTDIWAFGCVLYEMLTGKRAFEGKTQASLIARFSSAQPTPMAELQPLTPPALGRLVRTCLAKNPDDRFQTAHDLWLQLQWIEEGGSAAGLPAPVVAGRKRRDRLVWPAPRSGLAALAAAAAWLLKPAPAVTNVIARFSYPLPEGQTLHAHRPARRRDLSRRHEDRLHRQQPDLPAPDARARAAQPIRGTDVDPLDLAFSPDGQSIAFFVPPVPGGTLEGATLKKIAVTGGNRRHAVSGRRAVRRALAGRPHRLQRRRSHSLGARDRRRRPRRSSPPAAGAREAFAASRQLVGDGQDAVSTPSVRSGRSHDDPQIVVQPLGGGPAARARRGRDGWPGASHGSSDVDSRGNAVRSGARPGNASAHGRP